MGIVQRWWWLEVGGAEDGGGGGGDMCVRVMMVHEGDARQSKDKCFWSWGAGAANVWL